MREHFQVSAFESPMRDDIGINMKAVSKVTLKLLLELLGNRQCACRHFLCLDDGGERCPSLVRRLHQRDISGLCMGMPMNPITQTLVVFREDIRRAKGILPRVVLKPVLGYRAPSFSIAKILCSLKFLPKRGIATIRAYLCCMIAMGYLLQIQRCINC